VRFFRQFWSRRLGPGTLAALLPGLVPWRTMPTGVARGRDRFRSRDGEIVHTSLHSSRDADSVRSMIVVITTRK
jgi:hypothetical protein